MALSRISPSVAPSTFTGDPRSRITVCLLSALVVALLNDIRILACGCLALFFLAAFVSRPRHSLWGRLLVVNVFVVFVFLTAPINSGGRTLVSIGALDICSTGLLFAVRLALKANSILALTWMLLGGLDVMDIGRALAWFRVPEKLVQLFLLTARYLEILQQEGRRLRLALKVRGFRPTWSMHTYRTFASFIGVLVVRSAARARRVSNAMRCRCYSGKFPVRTYR